MRVSRVPFVSAPAVPLVAKLAPWVAVRFAALPLFLLAAVPSNVLAFPVPIELGTVPRFWGHAPDALVAFSPPVRPGDEPEPAPLQVDSRTKQLNLLFTGQSVPFDDAPHLERTGGILPERASRAYPLEATDVALAREESFRPCDESCARKARADIMRTCGEGTVVAKARLSEGRALFLAPCNNGAPAVFRAAWRSRPPEVRMSLARRRLWSEELEYVYDEGNHMLLDAFRLRGDPGLVTLLTGSEMHLYGRPRYFFPLHFTGSDVRSELLAYMQKPLGTSGQLSFFLDVLFFKVKLDLRSAVTIFRDAVHVPVVMSLPVSGTSVREGSGMFYGFKAASKEVLAGLRTTLPRLGAKATPADKANRRPTVFLSSQGACVAVVLDQPSTFARLGFAAKIAFPSDLAAFGFPAVGADFGVFCDVRPLLKGRYRFDVWFYVAHGAKCAGLEAIAERGFDVELAAML